MTFSKIIVATAASALMVASVPAFAQQGTTLAGPAQGSKSDGSASTAPSGQSGANGGAMMKSGGAMTGSSAGASTGTMSGGSTATGGNVGGPAGRN